MKNLEAEYQIDLFTLLTMEQIKPLINDEFRFSDDFFEGISLHRWFRKKCGCIRDVQIMMWPHDAAMFPAVLFDSLKPSFMLKKPSTLFYSPFSEAMLPDITAPSFLNAVKFLTGEDN